MSMDRLFGKIKQLPTIPKLLHELMQSFNDEINSNAIGLSIRGIPTR